MKEAPNDHVACEATVLHQSDCIQGGCDLLMIDPSSHALVAINQSLYDEMDAPVSLSDVILPADCQQLREDISQRGGLTPRIVCRNDGQRIWARPYRSGPVIGLEFSPKTESLTTDNKSNHYFAQVVKDLSQRHDTAMNAAISSEDAYFQVLARGVRQLTHFDRVMIYKFDPDWNGAVIAEDVSHGKDCFLGLKFPSGDIPKPARDLFLRSKVRQIIDVDATPEPMISPVGRKPFVFDQTDSIYRYSSPIHLDYLRNMGVTASLTIAIQVGGRLWGLLSCHHQSGPHRIPVAELTLSHVLSDLASNHVARLEERRRNNLNEITSKLLSDISVSSISAGSEEDLAGIVISNEHKLLNILSAQGIQFESETANWIIGDIPTPTALAKIDNFAKTWLNAQEKSALATSDLSSFLVNDVVRGGLLYAHSWDNKTCLKVFRNAMVEEDVWAGDPDAKTRYHLDNSRILHPRNSFEAFKVLTKDRSEDWLPEEIAAAEVLQIGLRNVEMSFHKSLRERQLRHSNAEMRNALVKADHRANHDPLTGLLNRRGLEEFVSGLVQRNNRKDCIWFCHIDLDHFKSINDNLGHHAGDAMLIRVAETLNASQSNGSKAARIGGDEFALLLPGNLTKADASAQCKEIIQTLGEPITFEDRDLSCRCTIGLTDFEPGKADLERLLKESDMALYQGKRIGRGRVAFFSQDLQESSMRRRIEEADLLRGIACKEFVPYFQPQFDCQSERIVGFEALSRWCHPERGILTPAEYLPLAAELGVLGDIDRLIFERSIQHQNDWFAKTGETVRLSVNISVDRLQSSDLISDLKELGEWSQHISLELLESIYLDDHQADFDGIFDQLRKTGVGIEIDDFGTGRTSILAVVSVKPDRLKIDKRLIDPIVEDAAARGLVKAILDIGSQLGIEVTAEGVETEDQLSVLQDLKCGRVQGYLISKPVTPRTIEADFLNTTWTYTSAMNARAAIFH